MAAAIAQTISIVDRSGKVVSTSKQLKNVFSEAKLAYQERKAEIKAERKQKEDRELRKAITAMSVADTEERSEVSRSRTQQRRPDVGRRQSSGQQQSQYTESRELHRSGRGSPRHLEGYSRGSTSPQSSPSTPPLNLAQFNQDLYGTHNQPRSISHSNPTTPIEEPTQNQLIRRVQTDSAMAMQLHQRPTPSRTPTEIDMDLAYGDFHAPDLLPQHQLSQPAPEKELNNLVLKCQSLLDEAQCATSSVKAIITHLQTNPDAMAAVALTLAEISNVAAKMAPGALTAFKGTAPAVFALLAAPEFLIAVGVGVGITIVMFGGYKIIKKIKERKLLGNGGSEEDLPRDMYGRPMTGTADEMIDLNELSHINQWRRGIAENEIDDGRSVYSVATSVEGEFITPFAQRSMGYLPLVSKSRTETQPKSKAKSGTKTIASPTAPASPRSESTTTTTTTSESSKSKSKEKEKKKEKKHKKREGDEKSESSRTSTSTSASNGGKQIIKVKKPSPLRRMFSV